MTTVNFSSVTGALQKRFAPEVTSQIMRASPILQILAGNIKMGDGQNIQWVPKFGTASAGSAAAIAEGADVATFNTDTKEQASLLFGTYHEAFEISGKALAAAAAAGNPEQLANLFESELMDAAQRLAHAIGGEIYSGTGAGERMTGLLGGAILDTGTYAGLSRITYPQWRGNVYGNGGVGRTVTIPMMRAVRTGVYKASGEKPGIILGGPSTVDQYGNTFGDQRRYVTDIKGAGGAVIKLDGGYTALEFDGTSVVEDVGCPEGKLLFLNLQHLFVKQLPQPGMIASAQATMRPLEAQAEQLRGGGPTRFIIRIQPLAVNGDKFRFALYCYPQVQVRKPNAFGILEDLNY